MRFASSLVVGLGLVALVGAWSPLHADPPDEPPDAPAETDESRAKKAARYNEKGKAAHRAGDYREAMAFFEKAFTQVARPSYRFNYAQAAYKLGDCEEALAAYNEFIDVLSVRLGDDSTPSLEAAKARRRELASRCVVPTTDENEPEPDERGTAIAAADARPIPAADAQPLEAPARVERGFIARLRRPRPPVSIRLIFGDWVVADDCASDGGTAGGLSLSKRLVHSNYGVVDAFASALAAFSSISDSAVLLGMSAGTPHLAYLPFFSVGFEGGLTGRGDLLGGGHVELGYRLGKHVDVSLRTTVLWVLDGGLAGFDELSLTVHF